MEGSVVDCLDSLTHQISTNNKSHEKSSLPNGSAISDFEANPSWGITRHLERLAIGA